MGYLEKGYLGVLALNMTTPISSPEIVMTIFPASPESQYRSIGFSN